MKTLKQLNVTTSLNKSQYIEFLQFCKKNELIKYKAVKLAVISYCKIQSPDNQTGRIRTNLDEELQELLKK